LIFCCCKLIIDELESNSLNEIDRLNRFICWELDCCTVCVCSVSVRVVYVLGPGICLTGCKLFGSFPCISGIENWFISSINLYLREAWQVDQMFDSAPQKWDPKNTLWPLERAETSDCRRRFIWFLTSDVPALGTFDEQMQREIY